MHRSWLTQPSLGPKPVWECRRCTTERPGYSRWDKLYFAFGEVQILDYFGNVVVNPRVCSRGSQGPSLGSDVWARWPLAGLLASLYILLVTFFCVFYCKSRAGLSGSDSDLTVCTYFLLHFSVFSTVRVEPVCAASISNCKRLQRG